MNIEMLRMFCDVVRHRSFTRAAAVHNVTQSAATQAVHRLEKYFGVPLVDRSHRPLMPTPEGQVCYEGFREVLELYDAVEARVRSLRNEISGVVRVASIYSVGLFEMGQTMRDFMRQYPRAKVRLEYQHPIRVYESVLDGGADIGIVSYPTSSGELAVVPLRSETMVVVCHPKHPLASRASVTVEHLRGCDFVAFDRGLAIRKELNRVFRQRSVSVRVVMEFDNIETIKQAVEIGAGVSILPEPTIRREVETGTLVAVPLIAPMLKRPVGIIHRRRKVLTPAATKFMEMLAERLGDGKENKAESDKNQPNNNTASPEQVG